MKTAIMILLTLSSLFFSSCGPSAREVEIKRIADSIRVSDSLMMVGHDKAAQIYNNMTQSDKEEFDRNINRGKKEYIKKHTISAIKLFQAYDDNEIKAEQEFGMKEVYIEGIIEDIIKKELGVVHIFLETNESYKWVICVYNNEPMTAKFLSKGKKVTFLGTCTGYGTQRSSIFIDECELIDY